jgi:hypothetical protein
MVKTKIQSLVQWPYFALCVHSPELTYLKIGESTKIGGSAGIAARKLPHVISAKTFS